jgi:hypothetical protein
MATAVAKSLETGTQGVVMFRLSDPAGFLLR